MTPVTAHDYAWIRSSPLLDHALETGYTLTLVRGVAPRDVLRVMEAEPQGTCTGADALIERQDELHQLGHVPEEPAEDGTGIVIDITDAYGKRLYLEVTRDEAENAAARARNRGRETGGSTDVGPEMARGGPSEPPR
ncbi:DUF6461 domain-containing protein [Streptomyces nodosus]|uniref:DUF6461 domain-containing protein n=1 Tax=Streptomyces nodosus TaxID=40318 RepID=UPI003803E6C8